MFITRYLTFIWEEENLIVVKTNWHKTNIVVFHTNVFHNGICLSIEYWAKLMDSWIRFSFPKSQNRLFKNSTCAPRKMGMATFQLDSWTTRHLPLSLKPPSQLHMKVLGQQDVRWYWQNPLQCQRALFCSTKNDGVWKCSIKRRQKGKNGERIMGGFWTSYIHYFIEWVFGL